MAVRLGLFRILHAIGETCGDESESCLLQGLGGGRQLGQDVAALPTLVEHALDSLYLTCNSAQPLADIVHDLVGKLHGEPLCRTADPEPAPVQAGTQLLSYTP